MIKTLKKEKSPFSVMADLTVCLAVLEGMAVYYYGLRALVTAFVSAAAYSLWAVLLKHNPVSKVAIFGFMNPVCGVLLSTILLDEKGIFGVQGIAALILVCSGIFIVQRKGNK